MAEVDVGRVPIRWLPISKISKTCAIVNKYDRNTDKHTKIKATYLYLTTTVAPYFT